MTKVSIGDLADEIIKGLKEYADIATEDIKEAVKKSGRRVRKEIRDKAPVDAGGYKKSWAVKKERETAHQLHLIVHSKNRYQLAHLLEHGHATRDGGRVKGQPHISLAEEIGIKQLEDDIEQALKG